MDTESVTMIEFMLACSPIAVVLVLMVVFRWGGARAGAAGWLVALAVSMLFFGADATLLAYSQAKGALLSLFVLYIIWMALTFYNVVKEAGAISAIADGIVRLTGDRVLQLLILSWVFSTFLEGVAGLGVPIAIVAPLLIGLGFSPITSVVAVAIGHSWSVTFGAIASSFNALMATSGLPGEALAPWTATLLGIACFGCGMAAVHSYGGLASVKRAWLAIILIGAIMISTQYILAVNRLWNLASFAAGLAGLGASAVVVRLPFYRRVRRKTPNHATSANNFMSDGDMPLLLAVSPYVALIFIVGAAELITPIHTVLNEVQLGLSFPATRTDLGWIIEAGRGKSISIFGHAGALLAYTSVIGYGIFHLAGKYKPGSLRRMVTNTVHSAVLSSIGIASMVGFAMIMEQSGMTYSLALGLSQVLNPVYPFLAPYIGMLGAFMTGSNTNSNVVFTALQQHTAILLDLPVGLILAAQTTGGSLGSMLAPAKIIVGCSTAGLSGEEGKVLRWTIVYGVVIAAVIGVVTRIAAR